ncbi:AAA family ATPase, partial [Brunnivagina elsteri]
SFSILRPEDWILKFIFNIIFCRKRQSYIPNVTSIPYISLNYNLTKHLQDWLRQDWEIGLHNIRELSKYTFQFVPIINALNSALLITSDEHIIYRVTQLAKSSDDFKLVFFASASLSENIKSLSLGYLFIPSYWRQRFFQINVRLDTPPRATAAGFWYLHEKQPIKAAKAFAEVRSLPYGEEMYTLAHTIAIFHQAEDFSAIANINPETRNFPSSEPLLRPNTWQAINSCDRVIADAKVIQNSTSRASRAFALNRAIGELLQILDNPETIPEAERYLIIDIATTWKTALEKQTLEVGQVEITKPVTNPYIVGDPVEGQLFVGRDDIMRQLEELWLMGTNMQSVVLYGHRRMGKTSILRNLSQRVGAGVKIAYVNLLGVGDVAHEGEVLMALSDAISQTVNIPPPSDEDLLNLPYRTFTRYLQRIVETLHVTSLQGLIIALDEFEKIEELIAAGKIPQSFMGYLRSLVQMSPKIGFILAGLHTLEEMTADYFQPLYASFTPPIKVSFMEPDATSVILANPGIDDFPLDYTPEALNKIYQVTHGQPFLVQLVGFQLVRRYNDRTFAMKQNTNPIFTLDDVETVINDPVFFQRGRYYFDGVWSQALEGAAGQQTILQALAPYPQGLTIEELVQSTNLDVGILEDAIATLIRHDVAITNQGRWQITVELFRRWVLR